MNELSANFLLALVRSGVLLSIAALAAALVARACHIDSPKLRRVACIGVLIQGCLLVQWSVAVPADWLPAAMPEDQFTGGASLGQSGAARALPDVETVERRTAAVAGPRPERLLWPTWVVLAWGGGMIVLVVRGAWSYLRFVRETPPPLAAETAWIAEWEMVQQQGGVRLRTPLHVTESLGPLLCRFPRGYRLLVPADLWRRLTPAQRRAVLTHELAHLRRHDVWKSLAARIMALPHWFNPLVWRVVREFDACAECACDEAVRSEAPDRVAEYARALVQLAESARGSLLLRSGARGGGLADRVRRLLQPVSWEDSTMKKGLVFSLLAGLTLLGLVQIRLVADEPRRDLSQRREAPARRTDAALRRRDRASGEDRISGREAVIDVAYLFRNLEQFRRDKEKLQAEMETQKKSMQQAAAEVAKLHRDLAGEDDATARELLEREIARRKAEIEADQEAGRRALLRREAEMYRKTYERIAAEVARYAKEHRIRIVRRADLSAQREEPPASSDPQEIIKRLNRDIVYIERDELDITDAIFQRLTSSEAQDDAEPLQR